MSRRGCKGRALSSSRENRTTAPHDSERGVQKASGDGDPDGAFFGLGVPVWLYAIGQTVFGPRADSTLWTMAAISLLILVLRGAGMVRLFLMKRDAWVPMTVALVIELPVVAIFFFRHRLEIREKTAPGGGRTHNLRLRRPSLYPIELRVRVEGKMAHSGAGGKRELAFRFVRGWSSETMKRFLLSLVVVASPVFAQSDVPSASAFGTGEGVNGEVNAVAIQQDGKVVIGGRFTSVNSVPRNNIARLNADGTLDRTFADKYEDGVNGTVYAIAIQPQGGIVVGGLFTQAGRVEVMNLARYNTDGSMDKNFGGMTEGEKGTNGSVMALAVQADGRVVVGGNFNVAFGQPRRSVARLNVDGTLDGPLVTQNDVNGAVKALAGGADDSVVAGGSFTIVGQDARNLLKIPAPTE